MIGDDRIFSWLEHRAGLRRLAHHPVKFETRSLEQNEKGATFVAAFGQRQIRGFVGFVDLVDFSTKVAGKSPSEISNYLRPFLSGVINAARRCGALIDKTIGDEVMFLIPEMCDDGGVPSVLSMGSLFECLCQLRSDLNPHHAFRIGLSYGYLFVDRIEGQGYKEWTIVGEAVQLAKRLTASSTALEEAHALGSFGVLEREVDQTNFESILSTIAGFSSGITYVVPSVRAELKGISTYRRAIFVPKSEP